MANQAEDYKVGFEMRRDIAQKYIKCDTVEQGDEFLADLLHDLVGVMLAIFGEDSTAPRDSEAFLQLEGLCDTIQFITNLLNVQLRQDHIVNEIPQEPPSYEEACLQLREAKTARNRAWRHEAKQRRNAARTVRC